MDNLFGEVVLFALGGLVAGLVVTGLAAWAWFRRMWLRRSKEYESRLASIQSDVENAESQRKSSEVKAEELKGVAEAESAKRAALEARIRAGEEALRSELGKKKVEIDALQTELKTVRTELTNARMFAVSEDSRVFSGLTSQIAELKTSNQELERQLSEQRQLSEAAKSEIAEQSKDQSKLRDLEGVIAVLREEVANSGSQKQAAELQARGIEAEFRKMMAMREEEFVAMQSQTVAAVEAQNRFEREVLAVKAEIESRDAEIARLSAEVNAFQQAGSELEQIREELTGTRANLAERNEQMSKLEADAGLLSHVRHGMRERQTRIDGLQLQLTNARQELVELQTQLSARNEAMARLEADAALLSHVRQGMRERQTKIEGLQLQLQEAKAEIAASSREPNVEFAEALADRDRQLQLLESNLMEAKAAPAALEEALRAQEQRVADLEAQLEIRDSKLESLGIQLQKKALGENPKVTALQAELDARSQRVAELESQLEIQQSKDVAQGENPQVAALQMELAEREARIDELQQEFAEASSAIARQLQLLESNLMSVSTGEIEDPKLAALQARIQELESAVGDTEMLRLELADREERLEAWESRYLTAIGEMHANAGAARFGQEESRPMEVQTNEVKALAFAAAVGGRSQLYGAATPPPPLQAERMVYRSAADNLELQARLRVASLKGIQFLPDSDEILPESLPVISEALRTIERLQPEDRIEIGGHTDSWGDPAHNRELSLRRAKAVRRLLVEKGVTPAMLIATGYGDSRPIADNDSADGRFANRRIEFQVRGPVR